MREHDHRHLDGDHRGEEAGEQAYRDGDAADELDQHQEVDQHDGVLVAHLHERRRHRLGAAAHLAPAVHRERDAHRAAHQQPGQRLERVVERPERREKQPRSCSSSFHVSLPFSVIRREAALLCTHARACA